MAKHWFRVTYETTVTKIIDVEVDDGDFVVEISPEILEEEAKTRAVAKGADYVTDVTRIDDPKETG